MSWTQSLLIITIFTLVVIMLLSMRTLLKQKQKGDFSFGINWMLCTFYLRASNRTNQNRCCRIINSVRQICRIDKYRFPELVLPNRHGFWFFDTFTNILLEFLTHTHTAAPMPLDTWSRVREGGSTKGFGVKGGCAMGPSVGPLKYIHFVSRKKLRRYQTAIYI